jgi:hypothetical protein
MTTRTMRREPLGQLPFWPRYLSREEAARYLGVSVDVFDEEVRAGVWPRGRPRGGRGGRLTWNRSLLDAAADSLDGLASPSTTPEPGTENPWDRRIAELERRPT